MAITYNAPTNTITITGYSEAVPATFTDIYNADVAGAWGVVSRQGTRQFEIAAKIRVGLTPDVGHLGDDAKQIVITSGVIIANFQAAILANYAGSTMRFGILYSAPNHITRAGCAFIFENTAHAYYPFYSKSGCKLNLLNCMIWTDSPMVYRHELVALGTETSRFWNTVMNVGIIQGGSGLDLYNLYISESFSAIYSTEIGAGEIVDVVYCSYAVALAAGAHGNTIRSFNFLLNSNPITCLNTFDQDFTMIDCYSDDWTISWGAGSNGWIFRQYTLNLFVIDKNGDPIIAATVTLKDQYGATVFSVTTGVGTGKIVEQAVTYIKYMRTGDTTYSPYTLEITRPGYESYFKTITVDVAIDWTVCLKQSQPVRFLDGDPIMCLAPESYQHDRILHRRL